MSSINPLRHTAWGRTRWQRLPPWLRWCVLSGFLSCVLAAGLSLAVVLHGEATRTPAPDVQYTTLHGEQFHQHSRHGQVVLVNFWATSCAVCVAKMPQLTTLYRQYHARGFELIAVAMTYDPPAAVSAFASRFALPFPVAFDIDGAVARAFGDIAATPTLVLIDRQGRIVLRHEGSLSSAALQDRIETLLAEPATTHRPSAALDRPPAAR